MSGEESVDRLEMVKRDFDAKIELAEEICTNDQLVELREYVRGRTEDWE